MSNVCYFDKYILILSNICLVANVKELDTTQDRVPNFLSTPESQDSTSYDNLNENVVDSINKHNSYYCYFLGQHDNWNGQTYNGYTTNLQRRLRQHNGED